MHKNKYFNEAKKRIRDYRPHSTNVTWQQGFYNCAIEMSLKELSRIDGGEDRIAVIKHVLMRGHSIESASQKFHYSYSTIVRWTSDFIARVLYHSGNTM